MDIGYLINILLRRKWLLLTVVLVTAVATWNLITRLPYVYKSKAIISTGIIDYKGVSLQKDNPFIQKFQIESSFNGLMEKMKSRNSIKLLTEKLLIHDLQLAEPVEKPFRTPDPKKLRLSEHDMDDLVLKLKTSLTDSASVKRPTLEITNDKLAAAFGYDYETLLKKLEIKRIGETDYLSIEYKSEKPELSYFVVSTFINEFFQLHEDDLSAKEKQVLGFQTRQLQSRRAELDSIIGVINRYKDTNQLVDVSKQRESIVGHIKELELKLEEQRQLIPALRGQINILNNEILKYNRELGKFISGNIHFSEEYEEIDKRIKQLQDQYVDLLANGKSTAAIEKRIEALREEQSRYIGRSISTIDAKARDKIDEQVRGWIKESLEKQLSLELAESAYSSYQKEIINRQSKADQLLKNDNALATLEAEKERIEREYHRVRAEYDEAKLFAEGSENPLSIIEPAIRSDEPEPKHRTVFALFAGVASGSITAIILFLLAFIDTSIQSPSQFMRVTGLPLLGYVNQVRVKSMHLDHLFTHIQKKRDLEVFKENIRKLRTAIEGSGAKSFLFVSPKSQEGKSFLIVLLAYSLGLNNKRVLLIDTNFKNNTLSGFKTKSFIEITTEEHKGGMLRGLKGTASPVLPPGTTNDKQDANLKNIDIVGNKGGNQSPSEILAGKDFQRVIEKYKKQYDFVFMEAAAMNDYSDARELMPFADKVVGVFSSQTPIGSPDKETIELLRNTNGKILGGILNNVDLKNI